MSEFFLWLEELSPWWWIAAGLLLGALEMLTTSAFLIWPGIAAAIMALLVGAFPGMPGEIRLALFAMLSIGLTFLGRAAMRRWGDGHPPETSLNERSGALVGRQGKVVRFADGEGTVEIDGIPWRASADRKLRLLPGTIVTVSAADGTRLVVDRDR